MAIVPRKLKNGRVTYWIALTDQHGEQVWERSGSNKRAAESLEQQRKTEIAAGTFKREIKGRVTVESYLAYYFTKRTNRTLSNDRALVRDHVLTVGWFASKPLPDVRRRDMLGLVEAMRAAGKLGEKSIATVYGIVAGAFRRALFEEVIHEDVTALPRGTLRRKTAKKNERKPYLRAEVHAILNARVDIDARVWIALAFYTGMRCGEVCGRRWRDWVRDAAPLSAMTVGSQYDDQPLKGDTDEDSRPRIVPVHPELAEILKLWWSEGFELVHCRKPSANDFIVPTRTGKNHIKTSAYKLFQKALVAAGVPNRTLHSTRHTFISVCRENGARGEVLERVTHNASGNLVEPAGTIDDYTTFGWRSLCEAVARLDFELDSETARASFQPDRGSRAWTRSTDHDPEVSGISQNLADSSRKQKGGKSAAEPETDARFDARQRRLLKLAEIDPAAARPGLALFKGLAAVRSGDEQAARRALEEATDALALSAPSPLASGGNGS